MIETGEDFIIVDWEPGPGDFACKHNLAFQHTQAPYVLLGADDLEFRPGWDERVIAVAASSRAGVIGTDDDANPLVKRGRHATHAVVSRDYIDTWGGTFLDGPGVVYHEGYQHQYVDTELVEAARQRGEWVFAHGAVVAHHHPIYDRSVPMDATYQKALADAHADKALYVSRLEQTRSRR